MCEGVCEGMCEGVCEGAMPLTADVISHLWAATSASLIHMLTYMKRAG